MPVYAFAQEDAEPLDPAEETVERHFYQEGEIAQHWENYYKACKSGDQDASENSFEEIREIRRKEGNPIMESMGYLFLQKAREESSLDSFSVARQDYLHAVQMNPYLWPAYVNLGHLKIREGKGWKSFVSMYIKGMKQAFNANNAYFILKSIDWFFFHLIWGLCFSFFLYIAILSSKYIRPHLFVFQTDNPSSPIKTSIAAATLFLPLLLGVNFYLMAGIILILFFPFYSAPEKRNALFVATILLVLPVFLGIQASVKSLQTDPEFRFKNRQFYLGDPSRQVEELTELVKKSPKDEYVFSLGMLKQKLGDYQGALENYQTLRSNSPYMAFGLVNHGNILFLGQKYQDAIVKYEKAISQNSNLVQAHYCLSSALGATGKHLEAEKALQTAKSLDSAAVDNWSMLGNSTVNVEGVTTNGFAALVMQIKDKFFIEFKLSAPFVLPWIYFIVIVVFALVHAKLRNPRLIPLTCAKCGKIYYPSESPNSDWCSQCVHIYLLKSDLPSEAKIMKHDEVKRYNENRNRIGFWSHVFLPGARAILSFAGKTGWFSLVFWILLLRFSFFSLSKISYPGMDYMVGADLFLYFIWGTTFIFWLIFGLRAAWQED